MLFFNVIFHILYRFKVAILTTENDFHIIYMTGHDNNFQLVEKEGYYEILQKKSHKKS